MIEIKIPVIEEWNHMFRASEHFPHIRRPFHRRTGSDDFVTFSEPYSAMTGEPVWFYSWGNTRWLRCPIGRPGDRLNDAGDRIAAVAVATVSGEWIFVISVETARDRRGTRKVTGPRAKKRPSRRRALRHKRRRVS